MNEQTARSIGHILGIISIIFMVIAPIALITAGIIAIYRKIFKSDKIRRKDIDANLLRDQYTQTPLMDDRRWNEYRKLKSLLAGKDLIICPMVSVLALTEPRIYRKDKEKLAHKLGNQYIDFVICNQSLKPLLLIRLLNNSRLDGQAQIDDDFANAALGTCNYTIVKTWDIKEENLKSIL